MTHLRMGFNNKITEERYNKIKAEAKSPKDDKRVMKKYGVGATSVRRIRNTENFYEFRAKGTTGKNKRTLLQCSLADTQKLGLMEHEDTINEILIAFGVVVAALALLIIGGIVYLITRAG